MTDKWESCPRCGSKRVRQLGKGAMFLIFLGTGSCLLWTVILFPPMLIFVGILILGSPLAFALPKMNHCQDCNKSWQAGKADEYKKSIENIEEIKKDN